MCLRLCVRACMLAFMHSCLLVCTHVGVHCACCSDCVCLHGHTRKIRCRSEPTSLCAACSLSWLTPKSGSSAQSCSDAAQHRHLSLLHSSNMEFNRAGSPLLIFEINLLMASGLAGPKLSTETAKIVRDYRRSHGRTDSHVMQTRTHINS